VKKNLIQLTEWETDEAVFKTELEKTKKGWTVVDVGSEFGYYAIKAGMLIGSSGKVLAVEMHPETYRLLRMNIKLHKMVDRIIPVCKAAGKERKEVKLYETISPGGTSIIPRQSVLGLNKNRFRMWLEFAKNGSLLKVIRQRYATIRHIVHVDTLDTIAENYGLEKIDLVKIDVEGAELDVLKGSTKILKRHKPILLVEIHFGCSWNPGTLYSLLEKAGYRLTIENYHLTIEKRPTKAFIVAYPNPRNTTG